MIKEFRITTISTAIVMIITGIVLLLKPTTSLTILCTGIAVAFFVLALTRLLRFLKYRKLNPSASVGNMIVLIICVAIGIYLIVKPQTVASILPVALGIIVIIDGIFLLVTAFAYIQFLPKRGILTWILGAASIALGIYSIRHSFDVQVALMQFLGIALIVSGAFTIINHVMIEVAASKNINATTVDFEAIKNTDIDGGQDQQ